MSEHYLELQHKAGTRAAAAAPPLAALPATRGEQNVQLRRLRTDWDAKLKSLRASEDSLTADAIVRVVRPPVPTRLHAAYTRAPPRSTSSWALSWTRSRRCARRLTRRTY